MAQPRTGNASPGQPAQISPAANPPSPRHTAHDEAYFPDEWGATLTARRLHVNRFETKGKNASVSKPNPLLDPAVATVTDLTASELKTLAKAGYTTDANYHLYIPAGASPPFDVTILFAVGTELVRHGLRRFFEVFTKQVLVVVSGIEGGWPIAQPIGRAWGVGITKSILDDLFTAAGSAGAAFTVRVLAGYSTGYRGIAGTINNFAGTSTLDLTGVKNVILYDALYRGDEPKPGSNTQRALTKIDATTGNTARVVVYEVTSGGTPREQGDTRVAQSWLTKTFSGRYQLTNLKGNTTGLFALIYARMFDAAVKDGYLAAASLPTALQNLIAALPTRGDIASTLPLAPFRSAAPTQVSLASWEKANATDVQALQKDLERLRQQVIADGRFLLMGWAPPATGEILHDGFIPEFGWEFLLG